jgi:nucleoside-diphosphate-sugar epimerase
VRVLVTGASGFLGSHVAEQLYASGHTVRLLLRRASSRRFLEFPYEEALGDVTDPASLETAAERVDAVVHAAALVKARSKAEFAAVNAAGTQNLIHAVAAKSPGARFVYISSLAAHGPAAKGKPRQVDAPPKPLTAYGRTKLAGEQHVRASALAPNSVIFRMPVIYGPRDPALVPFFQLARLRVAPLLAGGNNQISIVYGEDAAAAIVRTLVTESDVGGKVYSPEDGGVHSWRDLLSAVEASVHSKALRVPVPRLAFEAAALASEGFGLITRRAVSLTRDKVSEMAQRYWVCSSQALRQDTGWEPSVDIFEGARRTGEWYKAHHWI